MHSQRRVSRLAPLIAVVTLLVVPGTVAAADGATFCVPFTGQNGAGQIAVSAGWERGTRATIEGQPITSCIDTGPGYRSGTFEWVSVDDGALSGSNIVQVGYGRCLRTNNSADYGWTNCNGQLYWYWAWGSDCGPGDPTGSGGMNGAIPLRIGAALSSPPPTKDIYVLRENVGGTYYYDAYVGGVLLQGTDALGNNRVARVAASAICWDSDTPTRGLTWFGETFNESDSMGGWNAAGVANHLDYTLLRYSINTGWLVPLLGPPNSHCSESDPTIYTCKVVDNQHIYLDTISR